MPFADLCLKRVAFHNSSTEATCERVACTVGIVDQALVSDAHRINFGVSLFTLPRYCYDSLLCPLGYNGESRSLVIYLRGQRPSTSHFPLLICQSGPDSRPSVLPQFHYRIRSHSRGESQLACP